MPMFEETVTHKKEVFKGQVFSVELQQVTLPDGFESHREIVRHHGGACVLALDEKGRVTLVRQYRSPFATDLLEVPAGKLEPGEDPRCCAARELQEETGFKADSIELLQTIYPSPGYCSEVLSIFLATGLRPGKARPDPGEILRCERLPLAQALEKIDDGTIKDAKTIVALLSLERRQKKGFAHGPTRQ